MDYLEIILRGYFNEYDCEALDKYFFREYKKAEKEQFYEAEHFFTGCMNALKKLEQGISEKLYRRKNELCLMLNAAENGILTYNDLEGKTVEQKHRETIEYCKNELEYFEREGKGVTPLKFFHNGVYYSITNADLDYIEVALKKAFETIKSSSETTKPQPNKKTSPKLKIDQIALKFVYEGIQITRENGNDIARQYGHNSGEKLFQRYTYFLSPANRKGKPIASTPKKLSNKIKLIESIIELLPNDKKGQAEYDVLILKKIYDSEYQ